MSIRRANPSVNYDEYDKPYPDMIDDPEGSFVHYADHLEELRACEQRVLDATRKALLGLRVYGDHGEVHPVRPEDAVVYRHEALAAIDALRGESE